MFSKFKLNATTSASRDAPPNRVTVSDQQCGHPAGGGDEESVFQVGYNLELQTGNGIARQQVLCGEPSTEQKETLRIVRNRLKTDYPESSHTSSMYNCSKVWLELYQIYGFQFSRHDPVKLSRPILKTLSECHSVISQGGTWLDYFKYKIAAFFSYYMKQKQPSFKYQLTYTQPGVLFGGAFYTFASRLKLSQLQEGISYMDSFSLSMLMSKKGMPRPTDEMVKKAVLESVITMTTPKPDVDFEEPRMCDFSYNDLPLPIEDKLRYGPEFLKRELRRTTREIFSGSGFSLDTLTKPMLPSSSANYATSVANHGTWACLSKDVQDTFCFEVNAVPQMVDAIGPISDSYGLEGEIETEARRDEVTPIIGLGIDLETTLPGQPGEQWGFQEEYNRFYWSQFKKALDEQPCVKVIGLKEALKIRCISKGPPLTYFVLKPLQKFMFSQLQKFKCFKFTNTPITAEELNHHLPRHQDGMRYHSGDYRNATDEIYSWVSEAVADELIAVLEEECGHSLSLLHVLLVRSLTKHWYEHEGSLISQARGQLMGSITSFPILNILNAALVRCAYELAHGVNTPLNELPAFFNGDDCGTAYTNLYFPIYWAGLGDVMGLSESVGKTYDSGDMISLNSRFYIRVGGRWVQIPYVNTGLLHGQKRSSDPTTVAKGKSDATISLAQFPSIFKELAENCGSILLANVQERFVYLNHKIMKTFSGPWHLPQWLCGLGVPVREPSRFDLQACNYLRSYYAKGGEIPRYKTDNEWLVQQVVEKYVSQSHPLCTKRSFREYDGSNSYGTAYTAIVYSIWSRFKLGSLLTRPKGADGKFSLYFKNLWKRAIDNAPEYRPMERDMVDYEPKPMSIPLFVH